MIEARGLTRRFGPVLAVDRIDLVVESHGVVGFLGPNGAGKTTTMRMLTGFLPMHEGTAKIAGFDVFEQPLEVKARVGYLPETPPLYPELSVGEYLGFVAEIRGVPKARRLARTGEVMERVGLQGWERRLLGSLSKGYRQRVGLAQALIHDPPVLILDEPTSGLDPAQLVGIRELVRTLGEDRCVVLSTHVLPEVEMLCDRVVLIDQGRIVGDGTIAELAAGVGDRPWVEVRLDDVAVDVAVRVFAAAEGIDEVEALDGAVRVVGPVDRVARIAVEQGWVLDDLRTHAPSLQRVFLQLVGKA